MHTGRMRGRTYIIIQVCDLMNELYSFLQVCDIMNDVLTGL